MLGIMMVLMALVLALGFYKQEGMESGANALNNLVILFLCDAQRLGKDHRESNFMSLDPGVMPCLEKDMVIVFSMIHGGLSVSVDARVDDIGFED
jgi:hypothetical protein